MALPYPVHEIEDRWRRRWQETALYQLDLDSVDPRASFYNLVEFPYPSADGLHVGHIFKYSGADAYGRYQRMRGRSVFQPMGLDSFGIHTENFALKVGEHPMRLTARTTQAFRAQLSQGAWRGTGRTHWTRAIRATTAGRSGSSSASSRPGSCTATRRPFCGARRV